MFTWTLRLKFILALTTDVCLAAWILRAVRTYSTSEALKEGEEQLRKWNNSIIGQSSQCDLQKTLP